MIWTWDLSVCLYLNLKHGDLDHSATMAGFFSFSYSFPFLIFIFLSFLYFILDIFPVIFLPSFCPFLLPSHLFNIYLSHPFYLTISFLAVFSLLFFAHCSEHFLFVTSRKAMSFYFLENKPAYFIYWLLINLFLLNSYLNCIISCYYTEVLSLLTMVNTHYLLKEKDWKSRHNFFRAYLFFLQPLTNSRSNFLRNILEQKLNFYTI